MNVKAMKKVIMTTFLMCCMFLICTNKQVMAITQNNVVQTQEEAILKIAGIDEILNAGNSFIEKGSTGANTLVEDKNIDITEKGFADEFADIGTVLVAIGIVTLLIVSAVMAIKWITATPDKQAKLKGQLIGLVIATVVIFGAIGIWNFVRGIMEDVEESMGENKVDKVNVNPDESSIVHPKETETKTETAKPNN